MRRLAMMLCLMCVLCVSCGAAEILPEQAAETASLELPSDAEKILGDAAPTRPGDFSDGLLRIADAAGRAWRQWMPQSLKTMGILILVVFLCALVQSFGTGKAWVLTAAGSLALICACTSGLESVFSIGAQTLQTMETFSTALLATLTTTVAAAGAATTAATLYAGTAFFMNVLLRLTNSLLTPLIYGFLAASAAAAAIGNETLWRVGNLLKWVITVCLKTISTAFVAYMSVSGVVSGSADNAAIKAVKLAFSTAVPVVGSIISDASETVLVGAGMLKNAVGVFGLLGLLAICVVPFTRIGLQYLSLKLASALSAVVDANGLVKLIDALASAMGMVLAMTAVALLLTAFCCISAMRLVNP